MKFSNNWIVSGRPCGSASSDSASSCDLPGGLGYAFSDSRALVAGCSHLEVDYENGDFLCDVKMAGAMIRITLCW